MSAEEQNPSKEPVLSIAEYRKFLDDNESSDEKILGRIQYLETLCRDIIRHELESYDKKKA